MTGRGQVRQGGRQGGRAGGRGGRKKRQRGGKVEKVKEEREGWTHEGRKRK